MKCPYCSHIDHRVLESRTARDEQAIRRRRECTNCSRRFTTFEEVERPRLVVVKRGHIREDFNREKLLHGMEVACRKRPVSHEVLRDSVARIERELSDRFDTEIPSSEIGDLVMRELLGIDEVALVRFASVYLEFDSPTEFREIVSRLKKSGKKSDLNTVKGPEAVGPKC